MSDAAPGLAFVVVPLIGGNALERCVAGLPRSAAAFVVGRVAASLAASLQRRGGVAIESDEPVPRRRAIGAALAAGEWIAFSEDTCRLGAAWRTSFETVRDEARVDAWSGPIEIDPALSARCIALAALEYGEFAPGRWQRLAVGPGATWQPVSRLPGLNFVVRARSLPAPQPPHGLIETEIQARIFAAGRQLGLHPGLVVRYDVEDRDGATVVARLCHGRIYGGGLGARLSLPRRVLAGAKCALLPLVLAGRGFAGLPRRRRTDLRAWFWVVAFALAWSAGEALGIAFGRGASLQAWR